jgi:hypothetical protein
MSNFTKTEDGRAVVMGMQSLNFPDGAVLVKDIFAVRTEPLERDDFSSNRHPALSFCWSVIFSENR